MKIEYLCDNIEHAEQVAQWIYDEFADGIRAGLTYEKILAAVNKSCKSQMPIRLIAMVDGKCAGTIALVENDLQCRDYTPWLAALYVDPAYRGNKIAEQLIQRIKEIAKELGYNELYLRTETTSEYYRKRGWQFVESCLDEFGLWPDVFKVEL